jgi:hypothetical protein
MMPDVGAKGSKKREWTRFYVALVVILKYLFEACFSNRDDLNKDLNNLSTHVLSKHCISNELYLVVCLACIFSK